MKQKEILKSIKARLKYLGTVKGFPASKAHTPRDLVDVFSHDAETILQFKDCKQPQYDELQMLVVEMCADLIYMSETFDCNRSSLIDALNNMEDFPSIMSDQVFPMPKFGPGGFVNGGYLDPANDAFKRMGEAITRLPKRVGKVSDGTLKNNEHSKLTYDQKLKIKNLAKGDPACTNGLTRIIVEFDRPDIVEFIKNVGLTGRPRLLGFMAKLCRYDMSRMDAIKKAYEARMITEFDIQTESLENRGTRFNMDYIVDQYGK